MAIFVLPWFVLSFVTAAFMISSWWVLYMKMGEPGWKCLVPFYGEYVLFKRVWTRKAYWVYFVVFYVSVSAYLYLMVSYLLWSLGLPTPGTVMPSVLGTKAGILWAVISMFVFGIAWLVLSFMRNYKIAKCFGHEIGYCLGITFLPVVFVPMLAFGSSCFECGAVERLDSNFPKS